MFQLGTVIFVSFESDSREEMFHRANVAMWEDETLTAEFATPVHAVSGSELNIYYEDGSKFMKVTGTVEEFLLPQARRAIQIIITEEPKPANQRACFRVSAEGAGLTADINETAKYSLVDVSNDGFAIVSAETFEVGNVVLATLSHGSEKFSGKACIRSVQDLSRGKYRCGLQALESESNLRKALQRITMSLQREQIQRLTKRS
jgi:c-di-GMP-binding flagellar brake protein YcgR